MTVYSLLRPAAVVLLVGGALLQPSFAAPLDPSVGSAVPLPPPVVAVVPQDPAPDAGVTEALPPAVMPSLETPQAAPEEPALATLLQGSGDLRVAGRLLDRPALAALYAQHDFQPLWSAAKGAALTRALTEADTQGLDPAVYAIPATGPTQHDLLLTDAFLRYAAALAQGRAVPSSFESDWRLPPPPFDAAKTLDAALKGDVGAVLAALAPQDASYQSLRVALKHYQTLAKDQAWSSLSPALPLTPGARGVGVGQLRARLAAEGFSSATSTRPDAYDAELAGAVKRFQAARGLPPDGVVNAATLVALNRSPAERAHQIRLNMERWRSLPRIVATTRVEVNVAAASVTLYQEDQPTMVMRAVVGAVIHPTPVLRATMNAVLFNPPWRVPYSIIEKEIKPAVKRDPDYLTRNDYAYVETPNGGQMLEQLPGPKNALGKVKFELPNPDDIYLHDTPSRHLFARAKRDFSHGCVRIDDPRGLALRLLETNPAWSKATIDAAIATGQTERVNLPHSLPVYILYFTAFVDPDGVVEFRDDAYGRDSRLAKALATRNAAERLAATVPQEQAVR